MVKVGTVISVDNNQAMVFTMDSEFVTIKRPGSFVGEQVHFTNQNLLHNRFRLSKLQGVILSLAVTAAVLICTLGVPFVLNGGFSPDIADNETGAVVAVDINPSIQMSVDMNFQVISAQSYNDDGSKVLAQLTVSGMPLSDAVSAIVAKAEGMGYLVTDKGAVLVTAALYDSATFDDSDYSNEYIRHLKSLLTDMENLSAETLSFFIEDTDVQVNAKKNGLTIGRELLYEYAEKKNMGLTIHDFKTGNVTDILDNLNAVKDGNLQDDIAPNADTSGSASQGVTSDQQETTTGAFATGVYTTGTGSAATKSTTGQVPTTTSKATASTSKSASFTPSMTASIKNGIICVNWTTISSDTKTSNGSTYKNFKYYKIVASLSPDPKYPEDGYLMYITDTATSSWSFNPDSGDYNQNPSLESGKSYYFSVTYVFENECVYANDSQLTIPQSTSTAPANTFTPSMSASVIGNSVNVSWTALSSSSVTYNGKTYSEFQYYKVVASTSRNPKYPEDGYLTYFSDRGCSSWSFDPALGEYNYPNPLLSGNTYYFSVTYVFSNGKFYANDYAVTIP